MCKGVGDGHTGTTSVIQRAVVGYVKSIGVRGCPSQSVVHGTGASESMRWMEYVTVFEEQLVVGVMSASHEATAAEYEMRSSLHRLAAR